MAEPEATIDAVMMKHYESLLSIEGVVGLAEGIREGLPCIVVLVNGSSRELEAKIPESLDGYPVFVRNTGELRALPEDSQEH